MDRRERAAVGVAALVVATGALVASPEAALARLAWLAADPVRYGLACVALALVRPLVAWPATALGVAVGFGFGVAGAPFAV
ncbi:MAG: TVP38/TMEM64 family protein, partial [Haloferacaceae archaeon]